MHRYISIHAFSMAAMFVLAACEQSGVCDLGSHCADFYDPVDCHSGEWLSGATCESLGYTASCNDGTDFKCRTDTSEPVEPIGGRAGAGSGAGTPSPSGGADDRSTLCYEVTRSGQTENLEVKCTPSGATTCGDLDLQSSAFVYSSRSVCLQDVPKVIAHWRTTGVVGGASPDTGNGGSGMPPPGGMLPTTCGADTFFVATGAQAPRGTLTFRFNGCFLGRHTQSDVEERVMPVPGGACFKGNGFFLLTPVTNPWCDRTYQLANMVEVRYDFQRMGVPYERVQGTWRPAFPGDAKTITIP